MTQVSLRDFQDTGGFPTMLRSLLGFLVACSFLLGAPSLAGEVAAPVLSHQSLTPSQRTYSIIAINDPKNATISHTHTETISDIHPP